MRTSGMIPAATACALILAAGPASAAMAAAGKPTLFVVSDSTARNSGPGKNGQPLAGWGAPLADYFDPAKVTVFNVSHAGQSSRTYYNNPDDWQATLAKINAGDFVLLVFGINDGGPPYSHSSRGSIPGIGPETKDLTRPDGTVEKAHSFGWYLSTMAAAARDKGAQVYLLTVTTRNIWRNHGVEFKDATPTGPLPPDYDPKFDRIERGTAEGQYTQWTKDVAEELHLPVLDLTNLCADVFEKIGREKVNTYFADHNHTTVTGADVVAAAIVSGLKAFPHGPFGPLLSAQGQALAPADLKYLRENAPR
jgi:rhamnogalacturonan acetylesterase